jgi:hypothetical protein
MNTRLSLTPRFSGVGQRQERPSTVLTVFSARSRLNASNPQSTFKLIVSALLSIVILHPASVHACATCYGQSDSPLASGVTWGILSLLLVVMTVLGSIVSFFVYINKRSAAAAAAVPQDPIAGPLTHHASRII